MLAAAVEQQKVDTAVAESEGEGLLHLLHRWMFNLVKKGLIAPNLAVRQVRTSASSTWSAAA